MIMIVPRAPIFVVETTKNVKWVFHLMIAPATRRPVITERSGADRQVELFFKDTRTYNSISY